ncbi:hypothetical protein GCM10007103_11750 [Salinimicrobium marinum]|uniref:BIG2 domain-containing protein n=1 Tax=Salinimicrobium marinum TaxID=680283 RepID=A0A918VWP4_9FLAO|nr:hypothetical protein [Salinimicrobium marinum]GHA31756.1 hypothetical protein GCM10007103_11750 [Salinimicrobium marinum]
MKKSTSCLLVYLFFLSLSCYKDDEPKNGITAENIEQDLYFGDEFQIEASSNTPITYATNEEYHARVSESGLVTAGFVGETFITLSNDNDSHEVPVTVKPKSTLYPEPIMDFGISKSTLIDELGTPETENEDAIAYMDHSAAAPMIIYSFDENDQLNSLGVLVETTYSSVLGVFLSERYLPANPDNLIFINALEEPKATLLIDAELYSQEYWLVIYLPYPATKMNKDSKRKILSDDIDELYKQ